MSLKITMAQRLALFDDRNAKLLQLNLRGVERETLRVMQNGSLSHLPHAPTFGSALVHPSITTDFSEALMEFITSPCSSINGLFTELDEVHRYTQTCLSKGELLWPSSMPCALEPEDSSIPIARYGSTNVAKMKEIYREGLGHRYGRRMQTIAGVHFNFSLSDAIWAQLRLQDNCYLSLQEYKTKGYFGLVRNFRRWFWLLLYLFGAAPAVSRCFVSGMQHELVAMPHDKDTFYAPFATSLRMGNLGYQSSAQDSLVVCYNRIENYLSALNQAIQQPQAAYADIGVKKNGEYQQLSESLLQIENEFYSTIRPKQTARSGETQLKALAERGVEYIEVRCLDVNPFEPLGLSENQVAFTEAFLLTCLLQDSPEACTAEYRTLQENQTKTVYLGRKPGLTLMDGDEEKELRVWANDILQQMSSVVDILDRDRDDQRYGKALASAIDAVDDPQKTLSAKVIADMTQSGLGYKEWNLSLANQYKAAWKSAPLSQQRASYFTALSEDSLKRQAELDSAPQENFDDYLQSYFQQYRDLETHAVGEDCAAN